MTVAIIAPGEIVRLKSGSPAMTVEGIEKHPANAGVKGFKADKQIRTLWFDANGSRQEALFWPHVLVVDQKAAESKEAEQKAESERAAKLSAEADANRGHEG